MCRFALLLVLLCSTARAERLEIALESGWRALRSPSANAVTADSLEGGGLRAGRELGFDVLPGLELWTEAAFAWGSAVGRMFQTLDTELDTLAFTVGARARYALHSRVIASARLDLGSHRAKLALRDDRGRGMRDASWGALTAGAIALDLRALDRRRLALGLRLEVGYVAASSVSMTATPEGPDDGMLRLQMTSAGLGHLDLSGATFGTALFAQF